MSDGFNSKFSQYDDSVKTKEGITSTNIDDGSSTEIVNNLDGVKKRVGELSSVLKSITDGNRNMGQNFQSDIASLTQLISDIQNISAKLSEKGQQLQTNNVEAKINELKGVFDSIKNNVNSSDVADAIEAGIRQGLDTNFGDMVKSITNDVDSGFAGVTDILGKISGKIEDTSLKANSFSEALKGAQNSASQFGQEANSATQSVEQASSQTQALFQTQAQQLKDQSETVNSLFEHMSKVNQMNSNSKDFIDSVMNSITTVAGMDVLKQISDVSERATQAISNGGLTHQEQVDLTQSTSNTLIGSMTNMLNEIRPNTNSDIQRSASSHLFDFIDNSKQMIESQIRVLEWQSKQESGNNSLTNSYQKQIEVLKGSLSNYQMEIENAKKEIKEILSASIKDEIEQDKNDFADLNSSDPNNRVRKMVDLDIASRNYGTLASGVSGGLDGASNALDALSEKNGTTGGLLYKYVKTGNLLGNESDLRRNLQHEKEMGVLSQIKMPEWTRQLEIAKNTQDREAMKNSMVGMSTIVGSNADAVLQTAGGMNLRSGGGNALSPEDKRVLDGFSKSVEEALKNVNATIRAVEEIDPNDETLGKLRTQSEALGEIKNQVDEVKTKSSNLATIFTDIWSGVKKFKNMLAGGLGLLGLGALLSPMSFIQKSVGLEEDEGKRRYSMAKSDAYMGADFNPARTREFARTMGDKYYSLSSGMIGFDEPMKYRDAMAHGVGGHYGSSPNMAAADMDVIARNTFAISKVYDLSSSTVANMMKTFYKDLGMSANEASYTLVSLAQTANSAGIPVEKYVQTVTGMANSLRASGVDGRQVLSSMNSLVGRGLRLEDAQSLVQSQARANTNMAKDYNSSAFFGMMSGQGGDPIALMSQGLMSHDEKGNPRGDYYQMMSQRVMQEAMFKGSIGGGLNNGAGLSMFIESLRQRGYTDKDSSMIADAAQKGHTGLVASLLEKADSHKDGGKQQLAEAMVDAQQKIAQANNQLAATQKIEADVTMAEKHVGEAINNYLTGPLEIFRNGFTSALNTIVTNVSKFADSLNNFLNSKTGQSVTDAVGNHPIATLAAVGAAGVGIPMGLKYAKGKLGEVAQNGLKNIATHVPNTGKAGKAVGFLGKALPATMGLAAIAGTAYGAYKLYQLLANGEGKVQPITPKTNTAMYNSSYSDFISNMGNKSSGDKDWDDNSNTSYGGNNGDIAIAPDENSAPDMASLVNTSTLENAIKEKMNEPEIKLAGDKDTDGVSSGLTSDSWLAGIAGAGAVATVGAKEWNKIGKSEAENRKQESTRYSDLASASRGSKLLRYGGSALSAVGAIGSEAYDSYQHPDRFSTGERLARGALDIAGTVGGGLIGASLGSAAGPAGTLVGGMAGSAGGQFLANKAKSLFGISDEDGIKREHDRYTQTVDGAKEKYTQNSNSLVNSNDDRSKAADRALREHGMKLDSLTKDQQQYMDNIFNQLKSMGLSDMVASFLAGQQTANMTDKAKNDADYAFKNDDITNGNFLQYMQPQASNPVTEKELGIGANYYFHSDFDANKEFWEKESQENALAVKAHQSAMRNTSNGEVDWDGVANEMGISADEAQSYNNKYKALQEANQDKWKNASAKGNITVEDTANSPYNTFVMSGRTANLASSLFNDDDHRTYMRSLKANETGDGSGNGNKDDAVKQLEKYHITPPASQEDNNQIANIINKAKSLVGSPYSEYDCSLLTQTSYAAGGISLARQADTQYDQMKEAGALSTDWQKIKPGALLFRAGSNPGDNGIGHAGIYIGNGKFIHSGGSSSGVTEQDFNPDKWLAYGNAEGLGAKGTLPDNYTPGEGNNIGGNSAPQTPQEALDSAMRGRDNLLSQMGKMAGGLNNAELLKDKVATGQLIMDGTTAMSSNGRSMTLGGVLRRFRENSGEKDFDRYGYGLHGAFTGDGKTALNKDGKADTGPLAIDKQMEKTYGSKAKDYHAYSNADQTLLSANDKAQLEKDAINTQNNKEYKENQQRLLEAQNKAVEENKAEDKKEVSISITAVDNSGDKTKKAIENISFEAQTAKVIATKAVEKVNSVILGINAETRNRR